MACRFDLPLSADGVDPSWWDLAYGYRRRLEVSTGPVRPDQGYAGYTVRLAPIGRSRLTGLSAGCDDLRLVTFDGERWIERPRHLLGCDTAELDLRFALPVDLADGG